MEPLLPTLRLRKRYIAVVVLGATDVSREAFIAAVSSTGTSLLGDAGFAAAGISVYGFENGQGIVKCHHTAVSKAIAVLTFISVLDNRKAVVHTAGVSGTVKGATTQFFGKKE
ncbi:Rpp14/Pop5 family protein [Methanolapillus millepedarum]|uniref:Ribonuclease P protein component 2 n=1 Tax=Methanolapillus millepedarum TaxID=3028296 RepID=A0AA96VDD2_9EURY|nr:hypothetical protein MsAc7_01710 [Methanosarcinaceae archaeon Ac7]